MIAEKSLIKKGYAVTVPDKLDDVTADAIPNPAVPAWLSLTWTAWKKENGSGKRSVIIP
jgi:hypothetical protein